MASRPEYPEYVYRDLLIPTIVKVLDSREELGYDLPMRIVNIFLMRSRLIVTTCIGDFQPFS